MDLRFPGGSFSSDHVEDREKFPGDGNEGKPGGWLWRISAGGWLDLERTRSSFITGLGDQYSEFLVLGTDDCVSVIASADPVLESS